MSKNCPINLRIKNNYENRSKTFLTRRTPVIIRLDGKTFHSYTKGLNRPFDDGLIEDMKLTTLYLCQEIQGAVCGYTQSDEISILVIDYNNLNSDAWFDYNVQKITSISASMATAKFNQLRTRRAMLESNSEFYDEFKMDYKIASIDLKDKGKFDHKLRSLQLILKTFNDVKLANFDSRCFNIPKEEVNNYFVARQRDAVKNSIAMVAQSMYSTKELHQKNGNDMQEMIFQKGQNWNDLPYEKKRGTFVIKNTYWNDELVNVNHAKLRQKIEYSTESGVYLNGNNQYVKRDLGNPPDYTQEVKIDKIRTKWESIKTPTFSHENFWYIDYLIKNLSI